LFTRHFSNRHLLSDDLPVADEAPLPMRLQATPDARYAA
jgi:hypothetical protein